MDGKTVHEGSVGVLTLSIGSRVVLGVKR